MLFLNLGLTLYQEIRAQQTPSKGLDGDLSKPSISILPTSVCTTTTFSAVFGFVRVCFSSSQRLFIMFWPLIRATWMVVERAYPASANDWYRFHGPMAGVPIWIRRSWVPRKHEYKYLRFACLVFVSKSSFRIPSRELTYPTLGKGKSSSKCRFWGIC